MKICYNRRLEPEGKAIQRSFGVTSAVAVGEEDDNEEEEKDEEQEGHDSEWCLPKKKKKRLRMEKGCYVSSKQDGRKTKKQNMH